MTAKGIKPLMVLLLMLGASPTHVSGQQPSASAPQRLAKIVYNGDTAALLAHLAEAFDVTVGLEADPQQSRPTVNIEVSDATLEDVLNAIVQSVPAYQWHSEGGSADVYPKGPPARC